MSFLAVTATVVGVLATPSAPCAEPTRAAVAFVDDASAPARDAVTASLERACFTPVRVAAGDDDAMRARARDAKAPWLLVVRAGLVDALQEARAHGKLFTVDVLAFDADTGARRGHVMRQATLLGNAEQVLSTREARRVSDDAVRTVKKQLTTCASTSDVVVLWHKDSDDAGKDAVLAALKARCVVSTEQIVGMRGQAMEMAHDLERPLLAFKARTDKATGRVLITADRVDAARDELKVLTHVDATDDVPGAVARVIAIPAENGR